MPDIYQNANLDCWMYQADSNWSTARDATAADAIGLSGGGGAARDSYCISAFYTRGLYVVYRSFFNFYVGDISEEPESATLRVYGFNLNGADLFAVRTIMDVESITTADFDSIVGWNSSGVDNESNVQKYSDEVTTWDASDYNTITLNATALIRIKTETWFQVCLIESVHDLRNVTPTDMSAVSGCWFADNFGSSKDPYLSYTVAGGVTHSSTFFGCNF